MGNPYLNKDESIILATHKVIVKSISSDVLLTNQRLIIVESGHEQFRPHTIPLAVVETVSLRENPHGMPEISITIEPPTSNDAPITLALAFTQTPGELRTQEVEEWTIKLRDTIAIARKIALQTGEKPVYPEVEPEPGIVPPAQPGLNAGTIRISSRQQSFRQRFGLGTKPAEEPEGKFPEILAVAPTPETSVQSETVVSESEVVGKAEGTATTSPAVPASSHGRSPVFIVAAAIVIIFAVIIASVFFFPSMTPGQVPVVPNNVPPVTTGTTVVPSQAVTIIPTSSQQTPRITPIVTAEPLFSIPKTGVWVRITSAGNFTGSIGPAGRMRTISGSGTQFYQIPARNEIVEAAIQKQDGSGNLLSVEIYNEGLPRGNATTTSPNGAIDIHVNLNPA